MVKLESFDPIYESEKTIQEAKAAFEIIKNAPIQSVTKKEKANNCENKAAFSFDVLKQLGFKPSIYWLFKEGFVEDQYNTSKKVRKSSGLSFNTKIGRRPYVFWGYHVAAAVTINNETFIYDPWTQEDLVKLNDWALSFYQKSSSDVQRKAYVFNVNDKYKYFGTDNLGKLSSKKEDWLRNLDSDNIQMYCGLAGITPNKKCTKRRFQKTILRKKEEIEEYMKELKQIKKLILF